MSKFRARALDATKPMPIFRNDELPDLPDFAAINRAVPQMPSGMEKEEECEHHLQRAISAQQAYGQTGDLVIPTPEVYECANSYEYIYPEDFKIPRQFIHMQPSAMEQDIPDYDMDSEDERWVLEQQSRRVDVTALQFEEMMDRLEKGSGQHAVSWKEAKALLDDDDDLVTAVYDYWLNKRLRTQHALIPQVRTERRDGSTNNNPYVAFRRRTEKMQTRKNRKNDEASYEKMLKLRRDLSRAVTLIEMVKRREKAKREHLHLNVEIFEKRYQAGDFSGQLFADVATAAASRGRSEKQSHAVTAAAAAAAAAAASSYMSSVVHNRNQHSISRQADQWSHRMAKAEVTTTSRKKREYKKRKHKEGTTGSSRGSASATAAALSSVKYVGGSYGPSSEDELQTGTPPTTEQEFENDPDGRFAFRRKKNCAYHAPILEGPGNWPWCSAAEGGLADRTYRYCLTSLSATTTTTATTSRSQGRRCIGFARRRIGRGGRFLLDRAHMPLDDWLLDHPTGLDPRTTVVVPNGLLQPLCPVDGELLNEIKNDWLHFRPRTPPVPLHHDQQERCKSTSESPPIEVVSASGVCPRTNMFFSDGCAETYCRPTLRGGSGVAAPDVVEVYDDDGGDCGGRARSSEFSVESFQSHQEELLEMQRRQLERISERDLRDSPTGLGGCAAAVGGAGGGGRERWPTGHSWPLSSSTSHFTVDSASAQFAVSAVVTTTVRQSGGGSSSLVAAPTTATMALSVVSSGCRAASTNGPINLNNISCNSGSGYGSPSNKTSSVTGLPLVLSKASMRAPIKTTTSDLKLAQFSSSVTVGTENAVNSCATAAATTKENEVDAANTTTAVAAAVKAADSIVIDNSVPMEVT